MTAPSPPSVDITCVGAVYVMHYLAYVSVKGLQDQVIMLCEVKDYVK